MVPLLVLTLMISVCGKVTKNSKIVGGSNAEAGAWPWQVSLHRNGRHFCGGSLINDRWILTAAHCFSSTSVSGLTVYLGREVQDGFNANEISRSVNEVINHEGYDSNSNNNDISLLQLTSSVPFTDYIKPVCLASTGSTFPSFTTCWVTGWGNIGSSVSLPSPGRLQQVDVPIVSNSACQNSYENGITENMMCAGLTEGGKDSCQGDSGGPMVSKNSTTWVQAGVVSFGRGCALPDFPGVYARVSKYESWIKSKITSNQPGFIKFQGQSSGTNQAQVHHHHFALLLISVAHIVSAMLLS